MNFKVATKQFFINVKGETTGLEYSGSFTAKALLSHAEQMEVEALRREFLGSYAATADQRNKNQATIFAGLSFRLTEAPDWWKQAGNGVQLYDDNVMAEVWEQAIKVETEFLKDLKERADKAKGQLAAMPIQTPTP